MRREVVCEKCKGRKTVRVEIKGQSVLVLCPMCTKKGRGDN